MYQILEREPHGRILASKDIRMLVYSVNTIQDVEIFIDGKMHDHPVSYHGHGTPWKSFDDSYESESAYLPLWKSPWVASSFNDGKPHEIHVAATDVTGQRSIVSHIFRVDDKKTELFNDVGAFAEFVIQSNFPRYQSSSNHPSIFQEMFLAWYALTMLTLLFTKIWADRMVSRGKYIKWKNAVSITLRRIDHDNFDAGNKRGMIMRARDNVNWIWTANVLRLSELSQQSRGFLII
jgi:hypothetical protein